MSPREPRLFAVYGFATTHDALAAEALIKRAGIPVVPVPSPKELGELCGIALRAEVEDAGRVEAALASEGLEWSARISVEDV